MSDLGVGSVLGALVSEGLKFCIEEVKKVVAFKSEFEELALTMRDILPTVQQIESLQGDGELKNLKDTMDGAIVLVRECSRVKRWDLMEKSKYSREIKEIERKMLKFCQIQVQLILVRNQQLIIKQSPPMSLDADYKVALVSEGLKLLIVEAKKVSAFNYLSQQFAWHMEFMLPLITWIESLQDVEVLKDLNDIIDETLVLVRECSGVKRWDLVSEAEYTRKIKIIEKKMFALMDFILLKIPFDKKICTLLRVSLRFLRLWFKFTYIVAKFR